MTKTDELRALVDDCFVAAELGEVDACRQKVQDAIEAALTEARQSGAEDCCMTYGCERVKPAPDAQPVAWLNTWHPKGSTWRFCEGSDAPAIVGEWSPLYLHPAPAQTSLTEALHRIAALHPETDSDEGYNEWGEAHCFRQAQDIARAALQTHGIKP